MTNVNKHGVDYSAIEIGDLVKLNMGGEGTVLGYVTYVDSHKIKAIWSDDFIEWKEGFSSGNICGHWKVVVHEPKKLVPTKPYAQLVSYNSSVLSRKKWGVFSHMEGNDVWAYWEGWSNEAISLGSAHISNIIDIVDVVVHEPKEQNLSAAQELSVQQESANFAHAAVQGIINAHAEKNESKEELIKDPSVEIAVNDAYAKGYHEATMLYLEKFNFSDFDSSVRRTWKKQDFKDAVSNAALGLTGEAGEVADLIKKAIYHGRGFTPENAIPDNGEIDPDDVKDELSDVLFYVSAMAQEFGFTLEDVAKHNREKLEKRFPEGFSTEASAQKKDKHGRKFPFKAKVVDDRDGNPTGMRHGLNYGRIVTVTGEIFGNCYKADGLTVFKDDLEEVTD
ncbi:nucleoside triphosphate pyrophosphohydrolase family protein [Bacillus cereus]|uniref:nucleoside triphosphate pyrophosphohydrolase family protein n=1 Tax=Bacillus cereus TaxID=1396 RepID=UPI0015D499D5|nr:nucleoside triphosphate pyrophosphohydrolase family protein [Bacillus cereus]